MGYGATWLADGRWVAAGTGGIIVGDGDTGRIQTQTDWPATASGFLPDYITAWPDGRVSVADLERTLVYDPAAGTVSPFSGSGTVWAASAGGVLAAVDNSEPARPTITLYDANGVPAGPPIPLPAFTGGIGFSPDGTELAVGAGQMLQLRDGRTGELRTEVPGHSGAVMDLAYAGPDQDMLWTAGRDGTGIAWDRTGQRGLLRAASTPARTWLGETARDRNIAVGLAAPAGAYNTVAVLDPRTGAVTHPELPLPAGCRWCEPVAVAITPDGRTALAGIVQYPEINGEPDYSGPDQSRGYLAGGTPRPGRSPVPPTYPGRPPVWPSPPTAGRWWSTATGPQH